MMKSFSFEDEMTFSKSTLHSGSELIGADNGAKNGFSMGISYYYGQDYGVPGMHNDQEGFYVLEGNGFAKIGDVEIIIKPGVGFIALPGEAHAIKCSADCKYVKLLWAHGAI